MGEGVRFPTQITGSMAETAAAPMETTTEAAPSKLEQILAGLSEADRELVSARFTELMSAAESANSGKSVAEKALQELQETQKDILSDKEVNRQTLFILACCARVTDHVL